MIQETIRVSLGIYKYEKFCQILRKMDLSPEDAFNIFVNQVTEIEDLPRNFNAETRKVMQEDSEGINIVTCCSIKDFFEKLEYEGE